MSDQETPKPDLYDAWSIPLGMRELELGNTFNLAPVTREYKAGISLKVTHDSRMPIIPGFSCNYSYLINFGAAGTEAGNHFHKKKQEVYVAVTGGFKVLRKDPETGESDEQEIWAKDNQGLHIPAGIGHKIISLADNSILQIHSDQPQKESDCEACEI